MITELSKTWGKLLEELVYGNMSPGFILCANSLGFKNVPCEMGERNNKTNNLTIGELESIYPKPKFT